MNTLIVSAAQMRQLEAITLVESPPDYDLIEVAGIAISQWIHAHYPSATTVVVCVGPGNNGADGLVVADLLYKFGYRVHLVMWQRTADARSARVVDIPSLHVDSTTLSTIRDWLAHADLIVDALLGIGGNRPFSGEIVAVVNAINQRRPTMPCIALDIPSGCHADTGASLGLAVHADITLSTGPKKQGLCFEPARTLAGRVQVLDIGLTPLAAAVPQCHELTLVRASAWLPARPLTAYKGTFGTLCVWAGSAQYPGAAVLATTAALRSGAGIVSLATESALVPVVWRQPELTLTLLDADTGEAGEVLNDARFHAYVVGPGLGRSSLTRERFARWCAMLVAQPRPVVCDADVLTMLSEMPDWPRCLPAGMAVLTPHLGELRRLCGGVIPDLPAVQLAQRLAQQWQHVLIMKGSTTVIAHPDGQVWVWPHPNPVLATGGSGDVLAGIIGALLAQGCAPFVAAALAVAIQGLAATRLRHTVGVAGVLPSDLIALLPATIQALRTQSWTEWEGASDAHL